MYRKYLLLLLLPWAFGSFGQNEIYFDVSDKAHREDFTAIKSPVLRIAPKSHHWPVLQAELGVRRYIPQSNWFVEGGLSWRHTRIIWERDINFPGEIDPYYGFTYTGRPTNMVITEIFNYGGVKIGGGHRSSSGSGRHGLVLPFGIQGHVPFASTTKYEIDDRHEEQPLYDEHYPYEYGIFYGLYFKPSYEFSFSQSSPWRFSIYAEGDLLVHNQSSLNPKFLAGGGLGVSYQLE